MQHNSPNHWRKQLGSLSLAVAGVITVTALWGLTRPPSNARDAGRALGSALVDGDAATIHAMLWPKEAEALHMSPSQIDNVLREVFCPAFKNLGIGLGGLQETGGGYDWYAIGDGHISGVRVNVVFGLLQMKPKEFSTTLTNLYLGLDQAELQAARKLGTEREHAQARLERNKQLARLGMPGLCDARDLSVTLWKPN